MSGTEVGWLIETIVTGRPEWWTGSLHSPWTTDSWQAVRFSRKEDAERVIASLPLIPAFATDHMWIYEA